MSETLARLQKLAHHQSDHQRQRRDRLEMNSVLTPTRPTFLRSRIEPIPCTTVQKMTGAIIIAISEMKPSPRA